MDVENHTVDTQRSAGGGSKFKPEAGENLNTRATRIARILSESFPGDSGLLTACELAPRRSMGKGRRAMQSDAKHRAGCDAMRIHAGASVSRKCIPLNDITTWAAAGIGDALREQ